MKFFKCSVYVLFTLSIANLAFSAYTYRDLRQPKILYHSDPAIADFSRQAMMRETQILQGILMIHHNREMHPSGTQVLCPLCDQEKQLKSIIVQKEN